MPRFGGYVLFARNGTSPGDVRSLTDRARDRTPAIVAIDQEGGRVSRLREDTEPMPSMMALGAAGSVELAMRAGEQTAFDLRRAGCTLNFAPVLDLATDPYNTVIGTRSFGRDPNQVAELAGAFADGLKRGGISPCFKHFPGHGATAVDSHQALPDVDVDEATLRSNDLLPFAAVASAAPAIMSAHVRVRAFDPEHPATLSRRLLTGVLRDEFGFEGALITDCLEMGALEEAGSARAAVAALIAGADLLLFSHDAYAADAAARSIAEAVQCGEIEVERLHQANERALRLQALAEPPLPLQAYPPHRGIGREISRDAITLLRGVPRADPLASIVVSFGDVSGILREAPALREIALPLDPAPERVSMLFVDLEREQRRPLVLSRRAHIYSAQAAAIGEILARYPDAIVASVLEPFDLSLFSQARHLIATYGDDSASVGGLADVLFGGSLPSGRLPVTL